MKNLKRLKQRKSKVFTVVMMSMLMTQGLYLSNNTIVNAKEKDMTEIRYTTKQNQKRNVMYYGDWSIW